MHLAKISLLELLWSRLDTDHIFHELFRSRSEWLRELTGLPLPRGCRAGSRSMKQMEIRCDLALEPEDPTEACVIFEFQLYHDHSTELEKTAAGHCDPIQFLAAGEQ